MLAPCRRADLAVSFVHLSLLPSILEYVDFAVYNMFQIIRQGNSQNNMFILFNPFITALRVNKPLEVISNPYDKNRRYILPEGFRSRI